MFFAILLSLVFHPFSRIKETFSHYQKKIILPWLFLKDEDKKIEKFCTHFYPQISISLAEKFVSEGFALPESSTFLLEGDRDIAGLWAEENGLPNFSFWKEKVCGLGKTQLYRFS